MVISSTCSTNKVKNGFPQPQRTRTSRDFRVTRVDLDARTLLRFANAPSRTTSYSILRFLHSPHPVTTHCTILVKPERVLRSASNACGRINPSRLIPQPTCPTFPSASILSFGHASTPTLTSPPYFTRSDISRSITGITTRDICTRPLCCAPTSPIRRCTS